MKRCYPPWRTIVAHPIVLALGLLPFTRSAAAVATSAVVFLVAFMLWRRFLSTEFGPDFVRGRDPETLRRKTIKLASVTGVQETRLALGRVKGLSITSENGGQLFVNWSAKSDPHISRFLR